MIFEPNKEFMENLSLHYKHVKNSTKTDEYICRPEQTFIS